MQGLKEGQREELSGRCSDFLQTYCQKKKKKERERERGEREGKRSERSGVFLAEIPPHEIIWPFVATWMDLDMIILSEVSQREKDKYHGITSMLNLKKMIQRNLFSK